MLAYSSISHAGFMLIGLSAGSALGGRALMYYLIPYSAMAFGSFAVVAARERELGVPVTLDNLAGFGWERPFLGVAMWFFLFGFAGLPRRRRLRRQVLRLRRRVRARLGVARDRRRARDARQPLLLPRRSCGRCTCARARSCSVAHGRAAARRAREPLLHVAVGLALVVSVGSLFAVAAADRPRASTRRARCLSESALQRTCKLRRTRVTHALADEVRLRTIDDRRSRPCYERT